MENEKFIDRLFNRVPGGYFGLVSMALGAGLILIAVVMASETGYTMVTHYVSQLGIVPGVPGIIFNLALIIAGIVAIPFFIYLGRMIQREGIFKWILIGAEITSISACVGLSLAGIFPMHDHLMLHHYYSAMLFFFDGLFFCLLYSIVMIPDSKFPILQAILGFIVAGTFGIFLILKTALTEWIVFFAIVFWVIETSVFTLLKKS